MAGTAGRSDAAPRGGGYGRPIEDLDPITARIVRESGVPELAGLLADRMPAPDLRSLLLHVARRRSVRRPSDLRTDRERDRTLAAAPIDARLLARTVSDAFEAAPGFQAVELSPVAPLGLNAVLGGIDQHSVLSTMRGTEVMADPTTALALESARRRRRGAAAVRLCAAQRVLRMQPFDDPERFQHFTLFALTTAGRAAPSYGFELEALRAHLGVHLTLLERTGFTAAVVRVADSMVPAATRGSDPPRELRRLPAAAPRDGLRRLRAVQDHVLGPLTDAHPGARFVLDLGRTHAVGYYRGLQLSIVALSDRGAPTELVDGGSTDWTAMLLSDRKERLFTSGIGLDRLAARA